MKLFSTARRPVHLGPFPWERLPRQDHADLSDVPPMEPVGFRDGGPDSLIHAMRDFQAMLDAIRDGFVKRERGDVPADLTARAEHFKAFGYYCDAAAGAVCGLAPEHFLAEPILTPISTPWPSSFAPGRPRRSPPGSMSSWRI